MGELQPQLPARVICILGMHRSGTSCLTGSLQEAGLALGECHTWNPHNLKGNRENQQFVDLHDIILKDNNAAWDNPPTNPVWSAEHVAAATQLLAEHAGEPVFGFKDPRAMLVLEGWKSIYPALEYVGIFRHPNAVAKSLEKRSGMSWEASLNLWYAHNSVMYQEYKAKKFPILDFDDDEAVLDEKIATVAKEMGLTVSGDEEKFYSPDLKNNKETDGPALPWKIRRLYKKLKKAGR